MNVRNRPKAPPNNLPIPISSFVGREREIAEVRQLLSTHRLVTLTGPGGCGKTRLAIRVAHKEINEFEDGVWLIELAPLAEPLLVPHTLASILGVHEQSGRGMMDVLADYLLPRNILLVIDNCEHLIAACAQITETLLQKCPDLKILATSREGLGITGEIISTVPPLSLPDSKPWTNPASVAEAVSRYEESESIQLFVVRAADSSPEFRLTTDNGAWVAEICRRLDGMPLAIELAAARVRSLSVQQIAQRLDDRFNLLTGGARTAPPRQQTLAATLDWSYNLLSDSEQKVLQRLSVFADGATLEAAEAVCADVGVESVLDALIHLVDKSLITADKLERGETRYLLLETIRQYALERLRDSGEIEGIYRRHLDWFLKLTEQAEPELQGGNQGDWLERLARENDNFRVALAWSLENDTVMALQLAVALGLFWFMRGHHFEEGQDWLQKTVTRSEGTGQAALRAKAFLCLGQVASINGDYATARSVFESSVNLYHDLNDKYGVADASNFLADTIAMQGGSEAANFYVTARLYFEESLASLREQGDNWKMARTLDSLGEMARVEEDYHTARACYEESLRVRRTLGDQRGIAVSLINLGFCAHHEGDYKQAKNLLEESLTNFQHLGSTRGTIDCLAALAGVFGTEKKPERAARLLGAAEALHESIHAGLMAAYADRIEYDRSVAVVRSQLSNDAFAAAWAAGRALTLEQAIDYALSEQEMPVSNTSAKEKFGGLTAREREAAALIAQGKSNREIAEAMVVGVRTVETYVTRILNKLGFDSRVRIATWAIEKGLTAPKKDSASL